MNRKISITFISLAIAMCAVARTPALKLSQLADARANVWKQWVSEHRDDAVLPAPSQLSTPDSLLWQIPDSLEPAAEMNFYYGIKGDAEKYPLYIYLHGSGPRDHEWSTGLKLAQIFDDAPAAYFIPQIPNEGEYYRWYQRSKQWAWERLLRAALASERIDPERIYLFGISEGGYGSQRLASFYADYLAAAGPMAGGEPLKNAPVENLRNTAFSLRTGADDRGFYRDRLTGYTAAALDSMATANPGAYKHWVELIPGHGHHIDYRPTTPWLGKHSRTGSPTRLSWENFEMDGRYRTGFGNIQVLERSNANDSTRTYYKLEIANNVVRLDVQLVSYTCTELDPHWGIELKFDKHYTPATTGRVRVFLDENMVDFSKPVTLIVNGKRQFHGKLRLTEDDLRRSCAEFGDPLRLYPASIEVSL